MTRVADIQRAVCDTFRMRVDQLCGPGRCRSLARPRALAMYVARRVTGESYPELGLAFGGRDHSTILLACRKVQRWIDAGDQWTKAVLLDLQVALGVTEDLCAPLVEVPPPPRREKPRPVPKVVDRRALIAARAFALTQEDMT